MARAANEELNAFSYSVSHDLRAPLRTVDGYARILEEDYGDKLDDEGKRLLGVVRDGSRRMGRLIDNLLDFSRLGRAPVLTRTASMDELVRGVIDELRPDCADREVEFVVGHLGQAAVDAALLRHALTNLIGNAIKYTGKTARARIEVGREGGDGTGIGETPEIFFIRDNGAGFDMRYSSRLFGVFQRLHSEHEYQGTGVGLAIAQRVISRHGGRIWATARLGEGATFYFTLRADPSLKAVAQEQLAEGQALPAGGTMSMPPAQPRDHHHH